MMVRFCMDALLVGMVVYFFNPMNTYIHEWASIRNSYIRISIVNNTCYLYGTQTGLGELCCSGMGALFICVLHFRLVLLHYRSIHAILFTRLGSRKTRLNVKLSVSNIDDTLIQMLICLECFYADYCSCEAIDCFRNRLIDWGCNQSWKIIRFALTASIPSCYDNCMTLNSVMSTVSTTNNVILNIPTPRSYVNCINIKHC